jgi:hypothetical protein
MAEQDDNKDIIERRMLDVASLLTALIGDKVMAAPGALVDEAPAQKAGRPLEDAGEER